MKRTGRAVWAVVVVTAVVAAVEFAPEPRPADGYHYFLADSGDSLESIDSTRGTVSQEEWQHGDRILSVGVEDGKVRTVGLFTVAFRMTDAGPLMRMDDQEWSYETDRIADVIGWGSRR